MGRPGGGGSPRPPGAQPPADGGQGAPRRGTVPGRESQYSGGNRYSQSYATAKGRPDPTWTAAVQYLIETGSITLGGG